MAELTPVKISDMTAVQSIALGDLLYLCAEDANSETGYYSRKITAQDMAAAMLNSFSFPLLLDKTSAHSVIGAINELAPVFVKGVLQSGSTSITLSDAAIATTSMLKYWSETWGLFPNSEPAVTAGSVTLTFDAQPADANIVVEVRNNGMV